MKTFKLFNLLLYVFFIYEFTTTNVYAANVSSCLDELCKNNKKGCYQFSKDIYTLLPAGFYYSGTSNSKEQKCASIITTFGSQTTKPIEGPEISIKPFNGTELSNDLCYSNEEKHIERICYVHYGAYGPECPFSVKCEQDHYWSPNTDPYTSGVGSCQPCKWYQENKNKIYTMKKYGQYRFADDWEISLPCQDNYEKNDDLIINDKLDQDIEEQITCSNRMLQIQPYQNLPHSECNSDPLGIQEMELTEENIPNTTKIEISGFTTSMWYKKFNGFSLYCGQGKLIFNEKGNITDAKFLKDFLLSNITFQQNNKLDLYAVWTNYTYSTYTLKVDGGENKTIQNAGCEIDPNKPCKIEITSVIQAGKEISEENITISITGSDSPSEVPGLNIQTNDNKTTLSITPNEDLFKKCLDSKCTATVTLGYSECPKGYYCTQGIKHPCPIGTTTNGTGKSDIKECEMMTGENGTILKDNYGKFYLPGNGSYIGIKQN